MAELEERPGPGSGVTRANWLLRALDRFASWFVDAAAYPDPDERLRAKVFVVAHFISP